MFHLTPLRYAAEVKRRYLEEWTQAVNRHGGFGQWRAAVAKTPGEIRDILMQVEAARTGGSQPVAADRPLNQSVTCSPDDRQQARNLFQYSIYYILFLSLAMGLDTQTEAIAHWVTAWVDWLKTPVV
ncbi:MAG: hypothetical protein ACUVSQ_12085 [Pseudanabaenaceae cyanobacterium]